MHFYASQPGIAIASGFAKYHSDIKSNFTILIVPSYRGTTRNLFLSETQLNLTSAVSLLLFLDF